MARRLGSTPFRELLPDSLGGDDSIRAAASALDSVLDTTTRAIPGVLLYARLAHDTGFVEPVAMLPPLARLSELSGGLASLPEPVLDLLAWQLHVEGYEAAVDVAAKRQLIAGSLLLHRRRGTPWAVRTALETTLRLPTGIRQWWEYDGKPYFFRVRLDVSEASMNADGLSDAVRIIFDYKNVRSWLDCLETVTTRPLPVSVATAGIMRTMNRVRLWFPPRPAPAASVHMGLAGMSRIVHRVRLWFPPRPVPPVSGHLGLAGLSHTRSRVLPWTPPRPVPAAGGCVALAIITKSRSRSCPKR